MIIKNEKTRKATSLIKHQRGLVNAMRSRSRRKPSQRLHAAEEHETRGIPSALFIQIRSSWFREADDTALKQPNTCSAAAAGECQLDSSKMCHFEAVSDDLNQFLTFVIFLLNKNRPASLFTSYKKHHVGVFTRFT